MKRLEKLERQLEFGELKGAKVNLGGVDKNGKPFTTEHLIEKINELVEAVNKLIRPEIPGSR